MTCRTFPDSGSSDIDAARERVRDTLGTVLPHVNPADRDALASAIDALCRAYAADHNLESHSSY